MNSFFKKSVEMNMKIEKFLDTISGSLALFQKEIKSYLHENAEVCQDILSRICIMESEADALEMDIKTSLYRFMLLPDARADVLSLVKSLDDIIDAVEEISKDCHIQNPRFPDALHDDILDLTQNVVDSADALLMAARAFFNEAHMVSVYISKVKFYEHEADLAEDKIKDMIFNGDLVGSLAEKLQLKHFVSRISSVADIAEATGDKLAIFAIKREI